MLYRRHGQNDSEWLTTTFSGRIKRILQTLTNPSAARERIYQLIARSQLISRLFYERYNDRLTPAQRRVFHDYINLRNLSFWKRRFVVIRYGFWFRRVVADIGLLLLV